MTMTMNAQVPSSGRLSVLLVAYQCAPGGGSVSQIGWEWYSRLCAEHDVTLVTHVRNRALLDGAGAPLGDGAGSSKILWIDTEWFAGPLYRLAKRIFPVSEHSVFLVSSLDYFVFDFSAWRQLARQRKNGTRWDVVHRVTPVTMAAPTWLGRLGAPLILGPLNSGLGTLPGFQAIMRSESGWLIGVRNLTRLGDALIGSSRHTARILTATRATLEAVAPRYRDRCASMVENGVDLERFQATPWPAPPRADAAASNPLNIVFVGRLIPVKGLGMLLDAIAELRTADLPVTLTVVGDGPMAEAWKEQTRAIGLTHQVSFTGNQPFAVVAQHMAASHVLCLPSVRESGGAVLLEAMASARPVIAVAFGGPAEVVDDSVGALIAPTTPDGVQRDLVTLLRDLFDHPEVWRQRGLNGRVAIEQRFGWAAKVASVDPLYREVIAESASHV